VCVCVAAAPRLLPSPPALLVAIAGSLVVSVPAPRCWCRRVVDDVVVVAFVVVVGVCVCAYSFKYFYK
jgi:hypothetical protein